MARVKQSKSPAPKKKPAVPVAAKEKPVQKPRSQRLRDKGRAAISLIRKRRATLADDFLDVGEALRTLKGEGMFEALGRADFDDVCGRDLDLAESTADAMIALSERIERVTCVRFQLATVVERPARRAWITQVGMIQRTDVDPCDEQEEQTSEHRR